MRHAWFVGVVLLAMTVATAATAEKSKMTQGKVTAVTADSITISTGAESMTFAADAETTVKGKGLGTKANEKAAKGEKMTLTDSLAVLTSPGCDRVGALSVAGQPALTS